MVIWNVGRARTTDFSPQPSYELLRNQIIDPDAEVLKGSHAHLDKHFTLETDGFLQHVIRNVEIFDLSSRNGSKKQKFRIADVIHNYTLSSSTAEGTVHSAT